MKGKMEKFMKYGIVVDSACDLRALNEPDIFFERAPLKLRVGEREFVDDFDLDIEEYMEVMAAYKGPTGSAAPSPGEWYEAFKQAEIVFAVTITGTLSGSYSSAVAGRDMLLEEEPDKKIFIIDSKSAGSELTMIVYKLAEYMKKGMEFEEIKEAIQEYQTHTHLLFVLESLDNLVKNGRVSKLVGTAAGLLGIKILGCASPEGTLDVFEKCRGKLTVYKKMVEEMTKRGYKGGRVVMNHCFNQEKADYIKSMILEKYPDADIEIMPASGLCSYYAERGGILLCFER